ncbi:hypothetical protein BVRB_7g161230 [Beta vulgaris subsp. vulgaris]|nr:hypothetical protein BVRB_7g161230 [Beta vulgaris subsp. vulgaris]
MAKLIRSTTLGLAVAAPFVLALIASFVMHATLAQNNPDALRLAKWCLFEGFDQSGHCGGDQDWIDCTKGCKAISASIHSGICDDDPQSNLRKCYCVIYCGSTPQTDI